MLVEGAPGYYFRFKYFPPNHIEPKYYQLKHRIKLQSAKVPLCETENMKYHVVLFRGLTDISIITTLQYRDEGVIHLFINNI